MQIYFQHHLNEYITLIAVKYCQGTFLTGIYIGKKSPYLSIQSMVFQIFQKKGSIRLPVHIIYR